MPKPICIGENDNRNIKFNEIKQKDPGYNSIADKANMPSSSSDLSANHVSYFTTKNSGYKIGNSTELYQAGNSYAVNRLPTTLNPLNGDKNNPYKGKCNGYTKTYTNLGAPNYSYKSNKDDKELADKNAQFEKLVKIQERCNVHSYSSRELTSTVGTDSIINILSTLYTSVNNEIDKRGGGVDKISKNWLRNSIIDNNDFNVTLKSKLIALNNKYSSIYHYDAKTDKLIDTKPSIDNFTPGNVVISADHYNSQLKTMVNQVLKDCICYADCNSYYVCYCYGNCNYY